jgi:hypothetical protein
LPTLYLRSFDYAVHANQNNCDHAAPHFEVAKEISHRPPTFQSPLGSIPRSFLQSNSFSVSMTSLPKLIEFNVTISQLSKKSA